MGLLQHRQRIADLVSSSPSGIPEDASYLEATIRDPARVRLFTEFARTKEWLSWAATQAEFRRLFDPAGQPTVSSQALAYWFAEHFVMNEELSDAALELVREAGEDIGPTLWSAIGHVLHMADKPRPAFLGRWLMLLIRSDPGIQQHWLEYALVASSWPAERDVAMQLFDYLTEPALGLRPSFGLAEATGSDIQLRGDRHWLRESWDKIFLPNLADVADDVLVIVDHHLRRAYRLLVSAGAANPDWDPVSFSRSAIEPHEQDRIDNAIDVLIDAGRDALEALLAAGHPAAPAYLESWADCEIPILRRLAIHGWIDRADVDDSAKITWLRRRGWLYDHQLRHEAFRLVEKALPGSDSAVAEQLVSDAVAGPPDEGVEDQHRAYERFNALVWINKHAPGLHSAEEALAQIKADYPDFGERAHPDLVAWTEAGFVPAQPPMPTEDFHEAVKEDPVGAVSALAVYRDRTSPFEGPTWGDALATLRETVQGNPEDGLAILSALDEPDSQIVAAIIRGWAEVEVAADLARRILESLDPLPLGAIARELSQLLSEGGRAGAGISEWHRQPGAQELAMRLWDELPSGNDMEDMRDPLGGAINMPAGQLALFWIRVVSAAWRDAGDQWVGLPENVGAVLHTLLSRGDIHSQMVEVVFASQVHFFFAADEAWCRAHVLPLLDWGNPNRGRQCWQAFLMWGRWNDGLLTAGLLDHYLETAGRFQEFSDELRRQLATHLAGVALTSEHEPLPWIRRFIVTAPVPDRAEWARQVAWTMDRLPPEAVEHQWNRWIRKYWQDRLDSVPTQLTQEEASAMAEWVIALSASIDEGVALALSHPATLEEHGDLLHRLDDDRVQRAPASFARLLAHLLRGTDPPFWGGHYLSKLVPRLRPHADSHDMNTIVEEAVRLGHTEAPQW